MCGHSDAASAGFTIKAHKKKKKKIETLFHLPIFLPDVNGLIIYAVLQGLLIQEVEEVFDSWWHDGPGAQDATEKVIDKLLQRSLKGETKNVRQARAGSDTALRHKYLSKKRVLTLGLLQLFYPFPQ